MGQIPDNEDGTPSSNKDMSASWHTGVERKSLLHSNSNRCIPQHASARSNLTVPGVPNMVSEERESTGGMDSDDTDISMAIATRGESPTGQGFAAFSSTGSDQSWSETWPVGTVHQFPSTVNHQFAVGGLSTQYGVALPQEFVSSGFGGMGNGYLAGRQASSPWSVAPPHTPSPSPFSAFDGGMSDASSRSSTVGQHHDSTDSPEGWRRGNDSDDT